MTMKNYIGYLDGVPNRRVYVTIRLGASGRLSITGEVRGGSYGQIIMHIDPSMVTPAENYSHDDIVNLWQVWDRWHLNDMSPGCEHQRAHADARHRPMHEVWAVGEHCPVCNYRYGHEWIRERLPEEVIAYLTANFDVEGVFNA